MDGRAGGPTKEHGARREGDGAGSTLQRLFWFGALWLGGVTAISIVAWGIRAMILP